MSAQHFFLAILHPHAVMLFVLALICLLGYGIPGYRGREAGSGELLWLLWVLGFVMALVSWVLVVFFASGAGG